MKNFQLTEGLLKLLLLVGLTLAFNPGAAVAKETVLEIASLLLKNQITEQDNQTSGLGQKICLAGGRSSAECPSYANIGQGICLAGGRSSSDCPSYANIGQGICLSGGRFTSDCPSYINIGQGICLSTGRSSSDCPGYLSPQQGLCLAKGQPSYKCSTVSVSDALSMEAVDMDWAWDEFYNEKYNLQWRCRGKSTGQFAEDFRCYGKIKDDRTWPGSSAVIN